MFLLLLTGLGVIAMVRRSSPTVPSRMAAATLGGRAFQLEVADTFALRSRGLAGRDAIPEDGGMLFLFDAPARHTFWMKGMRFSIDIVWLRGETIVGIAERAAPPPEEAAGDNLARYEPSEPVDRVVEIRAGKAGELGLKTGQRIGILLP